jgi:hypothetical protein
MNEHNNTTWQLLPVAELSPAAARLLLALEMLQPGESVHDAVGRSGIIEMETYLKAYKALVKRGFIYMHEGREYVTRYAPQSELARLTEPVATTWPGTITKVSNAKQ